MRFITLRAKKLFWLFQEIRPRCVDSKDEENIEIVKNHSSAGFTERGNLRLVKKRYYELDIAILHRQVGGYSIIFYVVTDGASITLGYSYWTCALNAHPLAAETV